MPPCEVIKMTNAPSLAEQFHLATGWYIPSITKTDLAEEIFAFYKDKNSAGMRTLFQEYSNFLLRGSEQPEEEVVARAKRNIRFVSYVADLMGAS